MSIVELALQIKVECDKFGASSEVKNTGAVYNSHPPFFNCLCFVTIFFFSGIWWRTEEKPSL